MYAKRFPFNPPTRLMAHWIRLAADPLNMKVVQRCADTLSIPRAMAVGLLCGLWGWLSERSEDGSIEPYTDREIEDAACWPGEPGAFAAFVRTRHVDARNRIRDWDEYMGPLVKARQYARQRQQNRRIALRAATDTEIDERLGRIPKVPAQGALCAYCHDRPAFCWDHVMPLSLGGKHEKRNIVPACRECNSWKLDGPVTAILVKFGIATPEQQDDWANRYGVFPALDSTRKSFPHKDSTFPHRGRKRDPGNSGGSGNLSREPMNTSVEHSRNRTNNLTEVDQKKELRTTGIYLSAEIELVSRDDLDEKAFKGDRVSNHPGHPSRPGEMHRPLQGIELVRAWCLRFYKGDPDAMLRSLKRWRAVLRPAGLEWQGQTIKATPALLVAAMNETLASPPDKNDAADVFVLKKLSGGHLHETRTPDGALVTEALANEGKRLGRDATRTLVEQVPDLIAAIGRPIPGPSVRRNRDLELARLFSGASPGAPARPS